MHTKSLLAAAALAVTQPNIAAAQYQYYAPTPDCYTTHYDMEVAARQTNFRQNRNGPYVMIRGTQLLMPSTDGAIENMRRVSAMIRSSRLTTYQCAEAVAEFNTNNMAAETSLRQRQSNMGYVASPRERAAIRREIQFDQSRVDQTVRDYRLIIGYVR